MHVRNLGSSVLLVLGLVLVVFMTLENWIGQMGAWLLSLRGPSLLGLAAVMIVGLLTYLRWRSLRLRRKDGFSVWIDERDNLIVRMR